MLVGLGKAEVELTDWNILCIQIPNGEYAEFFVGYSQKDGLGRMSTKIEEYDPETGIGKTNSGSSYQTKGKPGMPHDDAIYVLEGKLGKDIVKQELLSREGKGVFSFKYPVA